MKSWVGPSQVLLAGTCFGFLGLFGKAAYAQGLSVGELLSFRFLTAALILGVVLALANPQSLLLGRRQIITSLLLGIFGYAVFSTLYFEAIKGISVGLAALLLFTFPLFVNLGARVFLKEKISFKRAVSLILSSVGLLLLVWGDFTVEEKTAVACGLGAAVTYAAYVLISGELQKDVPALPSSFYVILGAGWALTFFHQPRPQHVWEVGPTAWLLIAGVAVICTIAPLTLFLAGLQKMPSSRASLLVMIEPVVATLAGALILQERMSLTQTLGAVLILGSMFLSTHDAGPSESLS